MSERLSSVEIEDVLSSIRRLVSEDLRPIPRGPAAVTPDAPQREVQKQALILTPALRVVSEVGSLPEAAPVAEVAAAPETSIEEVVAAVSAAVGAGSQDWESETGDPAPDLDNHWDETEWDTPEAVDLVDTGPVTAGAASGVLVDTVIEVVDTETDPPGWAQAGGDEPFVFHSRQAPEVASVHADEDWVDEAEAEVIAGLQQPEAGPDVGPGPVNLLDDGPEMTFDEEVLRDLVRDLIREELQGHLGERITRNIRKLVRAEIARALAAAEFD